VAVCRLLNTLSIVRFDSGFKVQGKQEIKNQVFSSIGGEY
jgi:hypothetical protein